MLITNASIVTWEEPNRILYDHAIYINNDQICDVGPRELITTKYPEKEILDAQGQLVMPGNICAHTHFYGAFSRGMNIPASPPKDFSEILSKLWWPLDRSLTSEDIYYSAMICLIDSIKHGTTTLIDHHASPNSIDGSLDIIAKAVQEAGLRSVLSYEVSDRNGPANARAGISENVRFIKYVQDPKHNSSLIKAAFGLHASLTLSSNTLDVCREAIPENEGFHIHAAESIIDESDCINKYGKRVIERLFEHKILGPKSIVAHAVHVDPNEMDILAGTKTWVTHQPRSNMNNGVGVAPVEQLLRKGVRLCLGNDGFSNSMWEEWKTAYLLQKSGNLDPRSLSASDVTKMSIYNNAGLVHEYFPESLIGIIAPGAFADLIFVDYIPPTPLNSENLPWHIIFGFHESMITTTLVAGKVLMKDRKLTFLDENEISCKSRELAQKVWHRYESNFEN
jgi:putative selenium metabolism protein SsnA